ncbi:hypothetical protein [uncultured Kiloniella sp.]|uniref:hypothetical protein n=1 Tax=uncultured Kiloniella sp. TaxID=1133091 RepID=UPI0026022C62|nr:hypothetical protein [uncultured Kiloniella sp.]
MFDHERRQDFLIRKNQEPVKILALKEENVGKFINRITRKFPNERWEILPRMLPIQTD